MAKVLIIDGVNLFIRSFAVIATRNNETGEHSGGLLGSLNSIRALINQFEPDKVITVFDGAGGSIRRRKIFEEYKSNRKIPRIFNKEIFDNLDEQKEAFVNQMSKLVEYCKILPFYFVKVDNIEADDSIAHIVSLNSTNDDYIIVSTDKDFLQLINKNCKVWSPSKKKLYDNEQSLIEEFSVHPTNFATYKSLLGDNSDAIPGIYKLGPKTMVKIFPFLSEEERHDINSIFSYCEKNKNQNKWYSIILENKEKLEMNYKLMQLYNVDIGLALTERVDVSINSIQNKFSPFQLRMLFMKDKLYSQMQNFDQWINLLMKLQKNNRQIL